MKRRFRSLRILICAFGLGCSVYAGAQTQPILFNPNGAGASGAVSVSTFDWAPGNAVQVGGNPAGGVIAGTSPLFLTHGKLTTLLDGNGQPILVLPSGVEFTFVSGFPEVATAADPLTKSYTFGLDPSAAPGTPNFFEIWVGSPPNANMLAGTGFNDLSSTSHRILAGFITNATGNFAQTTSNCGGAATTLFDQFLGDDYSGQLTVCGIGSTSISVDISSVDVTYFPSITPDVVNTTVAYFNTSTVVPFQQANPSHLFVDDGAGFDGQSPPAPSIAPALGTVNGGLQNSATLDFQIQADANQSFMLGTPVSQGGCRVTYGGNDVNGNVTPSKLASACFGSGNNQNCYTFGGQVGAPTANPAFGGPFGEHTHHNFSGPAGDFVFHAGTHSAPESTRITATACKDPGSCQPAAANANFKQIDFEGTGSFRSLDATAKAYLSARAGHPVLPDNQDATVYYFRVDMDDNGEPGNKASSKPSDIRACQRFFAADQNNPLNVPDPLLTTYASCQACADVYQFYICKDGNSCEQKDAIYAVRAFLTGGNIQLHPIIK